MTVDDGPIIRLVRRCANTSGDMADAQSLQADISGVDTNGMPEPWRLVLARHPRNIGDIVDDPNRGPWNSTHNGKSYQGTYDAFD
ncbi:MAG: hypothetical protein ACRDT5_22495, partial [Mycobacterium sp.]